MNCYNHPDREPEWYCANCNAYYCADCADAKMFGAVRVEICPHCKDKIVRIDQVKPVQPFWERIPEILRFPLDDDGWMRILAIGAFAVLLLGLGKLGMVVGGLFGFFGSLMLFGIYYGIVYSYFYKVISRSEAGDLTAPDWSSFGGPDGGFFFPVTQFFLTSLVVFMPMLIFFMLSLAFVGFNTTTWVAFLFSPLGIVILAILGLAGLAILPMGLLLLGVFRTVMNAWNPFIIVGQIMKIPKEYTAALGFMILMMVAYIIVKVIFEFIMVGLSMDAMILPWLVRIFVESTLLFYFLVVFGHLLGYMAYQCRYELGWWKETQNRPDFSPPHEHAAAGQEQTAGAGAQVASAAAGLTAAAASAAVGVAANTSAPDLSMQEGLRLMQSGDLNLAKEQFLIVLENDPENFEALRQLLAIAVGQRDIQTVKDKGDKVIQMLMAHKDQAQSAHYYKMVISVAPDFTLPPRNHIVLAKWLVAQGMFVESAAAYRQYAVSYPQDGMAPKSLYQCAEILRQKAGNPKAAAQMYDYLIKRYPDSDLVPFAQDALSNISQS